MRDDHDQVYAPWIAGGVSDVTRKSEFHHFLTLVVLFFKALVSVRKIKGYLGLQENSLTFFSLVYCVILGQVSICAPLSEPFIRIYLADFADAVENKALSKAPLSGAITRPF